MTEYTSENQKNIAVETQPEQEIKLIPQWRFLLPLIVQIGLIFSIPIQPLYTQVTGKTVVLQTVPVDPYDLLRGYSQTLAYDISNPNNLIKLSGWQELVKKYQKLPTKNNSTDKPLLPNGTKIFVILEAPKKDLASPPLAWKPVAIGDRLPESLGENRIALQGKYKHLWGVGAIEYGLETYYLPEANIDQINQDINEARFGKNLQPVVLEAKIDSQGKAVPISFWIGKQNYRY
jgi:uncharacterized membrane-anchored protein